MNIGGQPVPTFLSKVLDWIVNAYANRAAKPEACSGRGMATKMKNSLIFVSGRRKLKAMSMHITRTLQIGRAAYIHLVPTYLPVNPINIIVSAFNSLVHIRTHVVIGSHTFHSSAAPQHLLMIRKGVGLPNTAF